MGKLDSIASIVSNINSIWNKLIERRKSIWNWFVKWKRGRNEDKVTKASTSRDGKRMGDILRNILKKRNKRHKNS